MKILSSSRKKRFLSSNLFVFILASAISCTNGCEFTEWSEKESDCPPGFEEIYRRVDPESRQQKKLCCEPDPEEENWLPTQQSLYRQCSLTRCESATATDMCAEEFDERYIGGKRIHFQELVRDTCTMEDGGDIGQVAYCCEKDSIETSLAATLGAEMHEFPHQVILNLDGGQCGGTIYNKRFIVTAAHCIVGKKDYKLKDPKKMKAMIGTNFANMPGTEYTYQVKKAIPHEKYSRWEKSTNFNPEKIVDDVAVLELDKDIKFSNRVKSLEIVSKNFDPFKYADNAIIVGWGTTDTGDVSGHLQKADFILRSDHTCFDYSNDAAHPHYNESANSLLCVGGVRDGKFSPTAGGGDSGGPAICRGEDGKAVLCGITSFGGDDDLCALHKDQEHCPSSVYAEVSYYHDWIVKKAGKQDPSTFYKPYVYGEPIPQGKYDHQVRITSQTGKSCGGTLVAPDVVVTAAQCVMKTDGSGQTHSGVRVHYGIRDIKGGGKGKTFKVKGAAALPGFPKTMAPVPDQGYRVIKSDNFHKDDLIVIKLDGKAPISPSKLPSLPEPTDRFRQGKELAFPRNTTFGGELRSRDFKILDHGECQGRMDMTKKIGLNVKVDRSILCGVEKYSGGSLCDRELGGGLICQKGGKDVLCGVQVFRLCSLTIPNGFMNMGLYAGWVNDAKNKLP